MTAATAPRGARRSVGACRLPAIRRCCFTRAIPGRTRDRAPSCNLDASPKRRGRRSTTTAAALLLLLAVAPLRAAGVQERVTIATVQFEVAEELYTTEQRFAERIDELVAAAVREHGADVVVFPEYINVFLIAARYPEVVTESRTLEEALLRLADSGGAEPRGARAEPTPSLQGAGTIGPAELVQRHAVEITGQAHRLWREVADRWDVTVVAGTLFVHTARGEDRPAVGDRATTADRAVGAPGGDAAKGPRSGSLRNRALVVGPEGSVAYHQDKVYLTEFEREVLRLEAGSIHDAEPFTVGGLTVGLTICRDTFFATWNQRLDDVDVWIDLRGNGEPYSTEVRDRFMETLPERVVEAGAAAGVNASLTGELLGYVWAGPSYVVDASGRRVAASSSPVGTEITAVELVRTPAGWRLE